MRNEKRRAADLAEYVSGVIHVQNNLRIGQRQGSHATGTEAGDAGATTGNPGVGTAGAAGGTATGPRAGTLFPERKRRELLPRVERFQAVGESSQPA
jgi:hypothetical protein